MPDSKHNRVTVQYENQPSQYQPSVVSNKLYGGINRAHLANFARLHSAQW